MWINRPTPTIPDWSRPDLFIGEPPLLIISQPTKNCKLPMHHTKKSAHALSPIWSQCPLKATLPPKALVQHPNFSHPSHVLSLSLPLIVGHPHTHTHCMHASKCMRCICTGPFEVRGGPTAHMACPPWISFHHLQAKNKRDRESRPQLCVIHLFWKPTLCSSKTASDLTHRIGACQLAS